MSTYDIIVCSVMSYPSQFSLRRDSCGCRKAFPALGAVAKISRHMVGYLACLIVVVSYIGGAANTRAEGLAEAHAEDIVRVLKKLRILSGS